MEPHRQDSNSIIPNSVSFKKFRMINECVWLQSHVLILLAYYLRTGVFNPGCTSESPVRLKNKHIDSQAFPQI